MIFPQPIIQNFDGVANSSLIILNILGLQTTIQILESDFMAIRGWGFLINKFFYLFFIGIRFVKLAQICQHFVFIGALD